MLSSPTVPAAQLVVNDNGCVTDSGPVDLPPGLAIDIDGPDRVVALHGQVVARGLPVLESLHDTW